MEKPKVWEAVLAGCLVVFTAFGAACASFSGRVGKEPAIAPDYETVKYRVCKGASDDEIRAYVLSSLGKEPQAYELLAKAHKYADAHPDECPCAQGACKAAAPASK